MCERCEVEAAAKVEDWQTVHDVAATKLDDHDHEKSEAKSSGRHTSKAGAK